jgi:hypothetical protein
MTWKQIANDGFDYNVGDDGKGTQFLCQWLADLHIN